MRMKQLFDDFRDFEEHVLPWPIMVLGLVFLEMVIIFIAT